MSGVRILSCTDKGDTYGISLFLFLVRVLALFCYSFLINPLVNRMIFVDNDNKAVVKKDSTKVLKCVIIKTVTVTTGEQGIIYEFLGCN